MQSNCNGNMSPMLGHLSLFLFSTALSCIDLVYQQWAADGDVRPFYPYENTHNPALQLYVYTYVRKNSEISESVLSSKLIHAMIEVFPQNMTHFDEKHHAAFSRDVGALALGCRMEQKLQTIARLKVQNQKLNL